MNFWRTIPRTLYPDSYPALLELPLRLATGYFFRILLIAILLMVIIAVPAIFNAQDGIRAGMASFNELSLNASVNQSQAFVIIDDPAFVLDVDADRGSQRVLINDEGIHYRKFGYFGWNTIPFAWFRDVPGHARDLSVLLIALALLLLPSLVVFVFVWFTLKYLLAIGIVSVLAWLIIKLTRHTLPLSSLFKIGLYASTFIVMLEIALFPLWRLSWWPLLVYLLFYGLVIILNAEPARLPKKKAHR